MIFAFGKFAIQAYQFAFKLGWKPQIYVDDVASASAIIDAPAAGHRRGLDLDRLRQGSRHARVRQRPRDEARGSIVKKYVPAGAPKDGFLVAGMASAFTMVDALKKAGKNLTRAVADEARQRA